MTCRQAADIVSERLGVDWRLPYYCYVLFWRYMRKRMVGIPVAEDLTDAELDAMGTDFAVPLLGSMRFTRKRWRRRMEVMNRRGSRKSARRRERKERRERERNGEYDEEDGAKD